MAGVKHPEAKALAERVKAHVGAGSSRDFASKIGLTSVDDERRVRSWLNGDSAPNFYGTLALLRAGGMLADAPARATRRGRALDEHELAAAIDEVTNVLVRLQRLVDAQAPPQVHVDRRRRRG